MKMDISFEEVKLRATKRGKCACGKILTRSTTFFQTLNPYNQIDGRPKTREEIHTELIAKRDVWLLKSVYCELPGYWQWTQEQRTDYDNHKQVIINALCGTPVTVKAGDLN